MDICTRIKDTVKFDLTDQMWYFMKNNRYRGCSRACFQLLTLLYYSVKSVLLLCFLFLYSCFLVPPLIGVLRLLRKDTDLIVEDCRFLHSTWYRLFWGTLLGLAGLNAIARMIGSFVEMNFHNGVFNLGLFISYLGTVILTSLVTIVPAVKLLKPERPYDEEDDTDYMECEEKEPVTEEVVEELPFCQLFDVGVDMCLLVDHIEMCPDETAFIRVVDDEGYTPLYKRKVRRDKAGNRFILFNGTNHYLDDKKTQPVVTRK